MCPARLDRHTEVPGRPAPGGSVSHGISRRTLLGAALSGGIITPLLAGCGALVPASSGPNALTVHTQISGAVAGAQVFSDVVAAYQRATARKVALLKNGSDLP